MNNIRLEPPFITIYTRILDNATNTQIEGYKSLGDKLNFGIINGITGGESSYIIEFDIWNNEPAIYGGLPISKVADAENCSFTAWDSDSCTTTKNIVHPETKKSYIQARNISMDLSTQFKQIAGINKLDNKSVVGNINVDNKGVLHGIEGGDHTKIQTKIVIPPETIAGLKNFVLSFQYDFI